MSYSEYPFKFAKTILQQHFPEQYEDILLAIGALHTPLGRGVRPTPADALAELLHQRGWQREQPVSPSHTHLRFDLLIPIARPKFMNCPPPAGSPRFARGTKPRAHAVPPARRGNLKEQGY